jgi:hypothetical protein
MVCVEISLGGGVMLQLDGAIDLLGLLTLLEVFFGGLAGHGMTLIFRGEL